MATASSNKRLQAADLERAQTWWRLPRELRRGLAGRHAEAAAISIEWSPRARLGLGAYVYHRAQVEEFWSHCDAEGVTPSDVRCFDAALRRFTLGGRDPDDARLVDVVLAACARAEDVRQRLSREVPA